MYKLLHGISNKINFENIENLEELISMLNISPPASSRLPRMNSSYHKDNVKSKSKNEENLEFEWLGEQKSTKKRQSGFDPFNSDSENVDYHM